MLHEIILEQKAQYSAFTVNIFRVNFWGNLYYFIRGKGKKIKSNFNDSWVFQKIAHVTILLTQL